MLFSAGIKKSHLNDLQSFLNSPHFLIESYVNQLICEIA